MKVKINHALMLFYENNYKILISVLLIVWKYQFCYFFYGNQFCSSIYGYERIVVRTKAVKWIFIGPKL